MPTPELVEALRAAKIPTTEARAAGLAAWKRTRLSGDESEENIDAANYAERLTILATDLPSIVRATVPLWEEEVKREVLRTLATEQVDKERSVGALMCAANWRNALASIGGPLSPSTTEPSNGG